MGEEFSKYNVYYIIYKYNIYMLPSGPVAEIHFLSEIQFPLDCLDLSNKF